MPAGPALAQPALWVVHGRHTTLYLFGSVHILPRDIDWEPAALTQAIGHAGELWFELPLGDKTDAEAARMVASRGILPAGEDLFSHLNPDQAGRVKSASRALGVSEAALSRMRPWLADLTLSIAIDAKAGAVSSQGVEQKLQASAPPSIRRMAFETASEQIAVLADTTPAEQIASLDETVGEFQTDPQGFRRIVDDWAAGDLAGLEKEALTPMAAAAPGFYQRLITDRNARWARVLGERLKGRGIVVVVVGAGHLIGYRPASRRCSGPRGSG